MTNFSEQQKQLKIQQGIRKQEDELVISIQIALDNHNSYGDLEESQFRNIVRVSDTTESTEVIKNFLLYQLGRDRKWGRGEDSLAFIIIRDIETKIKNIAITIAEYAKTDDPDDLKNIHLELTRRYLGYGARYLVYKRKGEI
ncbi:hypothetical protein I8748_31170 [Nostoc sp. CENA67]|uniref:Uncharacterized protein n=1 Tax=Amazonocrinis nigriterrae CENA67 TaxID=2794033 RepID=A0A8J7HV64_9NOST|nr:hypothetical protein [Amazonocrinis nigriterrae]MBH8566563.1 hypothetical protein [Amazonocrinis nigriterrae CENA67]